MISMKLTEIEKAITTGEISQAHLLAFPIPMYEMPPGWLTVAEMQVLYSLAALLPGPILVFCDTLHDEREGREYGSFLNGRRRD